MKLKFAIFFSMCCQFCFAQNWQPLGYGLSWNPTCLFADSVSNLLFAGGGFVYADSQYVRGTGTFDGNNWAPLGPGINDCSWGPGGNSNVWAIARYGNCIYYCGNFDCAGYLDNTSAFARWNGTLWDTVPGGRIAGGGILKDIIVYNNEMYICGTFDSVGSLPAKGIAKWDGTTWSMIGNNYNFTLAGNFLTKMIFYHGELYVAGNMQDPQGNGCRLAKWDGVSWQFLTTIGNSGLNIWDLEVYNDELYVAGGFDYGGGNPGACIIRWNDTTWRDVGGSVQMGTLNQYPVVKEMCVHNGQLYCVGNFEKIGGVNALGLASWNGNQWCGYDTHFDFSAPNEFVGAWNIAFFRDTMYVGGGFQFMDTLQVNYIARWVGGNFVDTCGTAVGVFENENGTTLVYPNPASEIITFQFSDSHRSRSIIIYDQLGREVWREETNENSLVVSVNEFAEGIYFYSVVSEADKTISGKFIIAH